MNNIIKGIIHSELSEEEKMQSLKKISEDLEIAKGVLSGEYEYCTECDDYYLSESYITKTVISEERDTCTYESPMNSGGNEYKRKRFSVTYSICPKGHKQEIHSREIKG